MSLIFRTTALVFLPCGVMALAVNLLGNSIPLFPWRNYASRVTMTIPKHGALSWNTTKLTPHELQGFHNDKNLLIAQSVSLHFPPKIPDSGCNGELKAEILQSNVSLVLPPGFFSLLSSIRPPFPLVETKEKIL